MDARGFREGLKLYMEGYEAFKESYQDADSSFNEVAALIGKDSGNQLVIDAGDM